MLRGRTGLKWQSACGAVTSLPKGVARVLGDVTLLCGKDVSDRLHHVGANPIHRFPELKPTFDSGLIDLPKQLLVCKDGFQMRSSRCSRSAANTPPT